ncbi:hypothetical protein PR202_ga16710 [Eleusine coracana subsp. coracana]|uniref:Uncharacterized protein n=1 Tax=Eleusine coracana subsp. coracana TaxID=191504 RepID=A0AAV5CN60_ELECO|nr:hypothetical protein PR202_ga16710 [Eleusine coracana subsp. coracana]
MCKLKGGGKGVNLQDLLVVAEDGLEEAGGSGGLQVVVSGMLENKQFLQSLASLPR